MGTPGSARRLSSSVRLACAAAVSLVASAHSGQAEETDVFALKKVPSQVYNERCHAIKECFCIRHSYREMNNVCGWCASRQRAMIGTAKAPDASEGECAWWIFNARDCPYLSCSDDFGYNLVWVLLSPILCFGLVAGLVNFYVTPQTKTVTSCPQIFEVHRTLAEFKKGLWGVRSQKPVETYQLTYEMGTSLAFSRLADSSAVWKAVGRVSCGGLLAVILMTVVRLTPIFVDVHSFRLIGMFMAQSQETVSTVKMVLGILFSFYVLGRVQWWWQVMDCGRTIQGRTHDIAMLVGGAGATEEHSDQKEWWEKKWTLFRHLMLAFFMCYRPICQSFSQVTDAQLEKLGFAEPEELAILRESLYPRKVVLKWISLWVEGNIQDECLRRLIQDKLCGLRAGFATLHDTLEVRAPWTFEALLYVMVYLWLLLMPLGKINATTDRLLVLDTPIFLPTLNFVIVATFYLTMLNLLESFKDPFSTHTDSMRVQTIFLETEASVVDYLTSPVTEHHLPVCKDLLPNKVAEDAASVGNAGAKAANTVDAAQRTAGSSGSGGSEGVQIELVSRGKSVERIEAESA